MIVVMKKDNLKTLKDTLHAKNDMIIEQARRIRMLEERFTEIRQKYIRLKLSVGFLR